MKFVSKNANLRVVLKHSMPPEPITGRLGVPGLYMKFESGIAVSRAMGDHSEQEIIDMMLAHPGFKGDFIIVEDNKSDPFKYSRKEVEPDHVITEMRYGCAENTKSSNNNKKMDPKMMKAVKSMAIEIAKEMAPQIANELLEKMIADKKVGKSEVKDLKTDTVLAEQACDKSLCGDDESAFTGDEGNHTDSSEISFDCSYGCGRKSNTKAGIIAHERRCKNKDKLKTQAL